MNSSQRDQQTLTERADLPLRTKKITAAEWRRLAAGNPDAEQIQPGDAVTAEDHISYIAARTDGASVECIVADRRELNEREFQLLQWGLRQSRPGKPSGQTLPETERMARALGEWTQAQMDNGNTKAEIPDRLNQAGRLFSDMIPFLIVTEHGTTHAVYAELDKLLKSFFAEEAMLIPLRDQEWLVLGPAALLSESENDDRSEGGEESTEDMLESICSGLHAMLASEWLGECHLAVAYPITPAKSIVETALLLHETVYLGRKFHVGVNIHLPWMLYLERLLNSIPEAQRTRYMEQVTSRSGVLLEPEIVTTLETFFGLDCNVSETAKKLYIHRNTLLYRLDKLKQETGLDVRVFSDAVLVRIILLLYKVTKRK